MTIGIAKRILQGITDKIECNTADIDDWAEFWGFTREEYEEFLDMAIKALEQEPILDRVRAEIDEARFIDKDTRYCKNVLASGLEVAMQIIDKYKGESEKT